MAVTTRRKALLELGDCIKKMKLDEGGKPVIVVVQSPNQALLSHDIPILKDMPILPLHPDESDKQLPPLGWQTFIAKRLVGHYLDLGSWISHLMELARYGDIPLCNLESNDPRFLIDIAYARRLQKERVILWWSGQAKPDHAGYEKDDILAPLETVSTDRGQDVAPEDPVQEPEAEHCPARDGMRPVREVDVRFSAGRRAHEWHDEEEDIRCAEEGRGGDCERGRARPIGEGAEVEVDCSACGALPHCRSAARFRSPR